MLWNYNSAPKKLQYVTSLKLVVLLLSRVVNKAYIRKSLLGLVNLIILIHLTVKLRTHIDGETPKSEGAVVHLINLLTLNAQVTCYASRQRCLTSIP